MPHNKQFSYLGQIGFAAMGDGAGPDDIDISVEVQTEVGLVGCLVNDLLAHAKQDAPDSLTSAAKQFLASIGAVESVPVPCSGS